MSIKLVYFNLGGRALPVRLTFNYGNVEFEDARIAREDWPAYKATTPLGQIPILELNGKKITQSDAILRFAATKAGLVSKDAEETLIVDEAVNLVYELFATLPKEATAEARTPWVEGKFTQNFARIEHYISESGSGFVAPSGVSIADFVVFGYLNLISSGFFDHVPKNFSERFPLITAAMLKIQQFPQLQKFFEANPGEKPFTA